MIYPEALEHRGPSRRFAIGFPLAWASAFALLSVHGAAFGTFATFRVGRRLMVAGQLLRRSPSSARPSAIALPTPWLAPVMSAALSLSPSSIHHLPASANTHLVEQPLRERSPLPRELIDARAQIRAQLPFRVRQIANLAQLVQGLTVMIEDHRR